MRVLITGGYGFIGSHVADRFHKEGHDVYIIDNLVTGHKSNVNFKHHGYIIDVKDHKCEEIFKAHKIDIVVHLAAQVSVSKSIAEPHLDTETNVLGLVNIIALSAKYKVKRFIYASSAAVYGTEEQLPLTESLKVDPIAPYGISKQVNEIYAQKWNELFELSTVGFRFSNVYGPRQKNESEGGVISIFINSLLKRKALQVFGSGEQTRDFIYVEDVADAIYRSVNSTITGVYNLSTNQAYSVNQITECLKEYDPSIEVQYKPARTNDILHSCLDNSAIMRALDWSPMYDLKEGLSRTFQYFNENKNRVVNVSSAIDSVDRSKKRSNVFNKLLPTLENLIAFTLTAWLSINLVSNMYGVIDVKMFYITIIGILYGNRQALLSVVLSIGLLTYQELFAGRDFISLTYDTDFFFRIAIYLFIGLVVGYAVERKNNIINQKEQKAIEATDRYNFLENIYMEVRDVKDELQQRILNTDDSYGKIYNATKELESLEPELVFSSAVNVVKSFLKVDKVSIYLVNHYQSYLRLLASSGYNTEELKKSLKITDHPHLQHIIENGQIFVNKELNPDMALMAAPIFHRDRVAAVITVDGLSFESFSLYHQNLFQVVVNLISSSLNKAFTFIEATESTRFINGTTVLKSNVFRDILRAKYEVKQHHQVPFLLLRVNMNNMLLEEVSKHISPLLRETDYMGLNEDNQLEVLLSNAEKNAIDAIMSRLQHPGLTFSIISEGD